MTCTATDDVGTATVKSLEVTLVDRTSPAITVPAAQTAEATSADGLSSPTRSRPPTGGRIGDTAVLAARRRNAGRPGVHSTGATALRYHTTGNQFIYSWQWPKSASKCDSVLITLTDGSQLSATFQLK